MRSPLRVVSARANVCEGHLFLQRWDVLIGLARRPNVLQIQLQ